MKTKQPYKVTNISSCTVCGYCPSHKMSNELKVGFSPPTSYNQEAFFECANCGWGRNIWRVEDEQLTDDKFNPKSKLFVGFKAT